MKIIQLTTPEEFLNLKRNDTLIVEWSDYFVKHTEKSSNIMCYQNIYMNKIRSDEIICRLKGNHYFNWKMYLGIDTPNVNTSQAIKVFLVTK